MSEKLTEKDKDRLIEILTEELPSLRAKIGFSQEDLCEMVGISRQTYSPVETKKRKMSWNAYLSLLMFFTHNDKTAPVIESIGAYPEKLKNSFNVSNR